MMAEELISRLREGDHEAFKILFEMFHAKVFHFYSAKTGEDSAADLTQQTFIKIWKYREGLTTEYSIEQQVFRKSRQIFIDWLRQKARERKHIDTSVQTETISNIPEKEVSLETRDEIETSLKKLPPQRRKVFELKHKQGYSYKEIAQNLGISVKTVDNHLLQASSQLRKQIDI